jgi:hypothetical protein
VKAPYDRNSTVSIEEAYNPLHEKDNRIIVWEIYRPSIPMNDTDIPEGDVILPNDIVLNQNVVAFNEIMTGALTSNQAIFFLGSAEQSRSILFYLLKYMSKDATALSNTISVIYEAKKMIERRPSVADDTGSIQRT